MAPSLRWLLNFCPQYCFIEMVPYSLTVHGDTGAFSISDLAEVFAVSRAPIYRTLERASSSEGRDPAALSPSLFPSS